MMFSMIIMMIMMIILMIIKVIMMIMMVIWMIMMIVLMIMMIILMKMMIILMIMMVIWMIMMTKTTKNIVGDDFSSNKPFCTNLFLTNSTLVFFHQFCQFCYGRIFALKTNHFAAFVLLILLCFH